MSYTDDFLYLSWHEYKYPEQLVYAEMDTAHWWWDIQAWFKFRDLFP